MVVVVVVSKLLSRECAVLAMGVVTSVAKSPSTVMPIFSTADVMLPVEADREQVAAAAAEEGELLTDRDRSTVDDGRRGGEIGFRKNGRPPPAIVEQGGVTLNSGEWRVSGEETDTLPVVLAEVLVAIKPTPALARTFIILRRGPFVRSFTQDKHRERKRRGGWRGGGEEGIRGCYKLNKEGKLHRTGKRGGGQEGGGFRLLCNDTEVNRYSEYNVSAADAAWLKGEQQMSKNLAVKKACVFLLVLTVLFHIPALPCQEKQQLSMHCTEQPRSQTRCTERSSRTNDMRNPS